MKAIQAMSLPFLLVFAPTCLAANDGFGAVTCNGDVAKALVGKKLSDEADAAVENRHKNLALKDLGGDEITDDIFLSTWSICGNDYLLTLRRSVVRDVLKVPAHSGSDKLFDGDCTKGKTPVPGVVVGILVDQHGTDALPAKMAWKLDETSGKFVSIPVDGLTCARHGIMFPNGEAE